MILVETYGHVYEVATFRRDLPYEDGRRPTGVAFAQPEEDAKRRDFTVNGLFYDPERREVLDFVDGRRDLERKLIRAIGPPEERFGEDHLRMLRAVRLAVTLDFELEAQTAAAIARCAPAISRISMERIQAELTRALVEGRRAGRVLRLMHELGLLKVLFPELEALSGQEQPPEFHPEGDVFVHTAAMLDSMEHPTPALAYAVLLHDVGKPPTAQRVRESDGTVRLRFNNHAAVGADMARSFLQRLRLSSDLVEDVVFCVANHMRFKEVQQMRPAKLRRLVAAPTFPVELELHRLDCLCSHGDTSNYRFLLDFVESLARQPALPPPWVTGNDLLAMGIPEGRRIGEWHRKAYEAQLDGRFPNREQLLEWIKRSLTEIDRQPG